MSTWVNVYYDNVLIPLNALLQTEFKHQAAVHFMPDYAPRGSFSIRIWPHLDQPLEEAASSSTRRYLTTLRLYQLWAGPADRKADVEPITLAAERVKRLLFDHAAYSVAGAYKWHDGLAGEIDYTPERTAAEAAAADLVVVSIPFACTVTEVIG